VGVNHVAGRGLSENWSGDSEEKTKKRGVHERSERGVEALKKEEEKEISGRRRNKTQRRYLIRSKQKKNLGESLLRLQEKNSVPRKVLILGKSREGRGIVTAEMVRKKIHRDGGKKGKR